MSKRIIYDPEKKEIANGKDTLDFYCGKEIDDVALLLTRLKFGTTSLQEAYIDMMKILRKESPIINSNINVEPFNLDKEIVSGIFTIDLMGDINGQP